MRGRVRALHRGKSFWSLNFGQYWRLDFSVQIPVALAEELVANGVQLEGLAGKVVEVYGRLSWYNGPNLRVQHRQDLKVVNLEPTASPWR